MNKKKILIVDDEKEVCDIIKSMLEKGGYDAFTASKGAEGIEEATEQCPDLVLLDILLPDIDGFEVMRRLRYSAATQNVPIVIVSGIRDTSSMFKAKDLRSNDYITKPFTSQELLRSVDRCIETYAV